VRKNKVAILFFVFTLGCYALTLFLLPELGLWIPSYAYHIVILAFPLILIAFHRESTRSLGLMWGRWKIGVLAAVVVILISFLVYWIPARRFFPPTIDHILFSTVIWGPIAEEILFRSYLQPKLEALLRKWPGLIITSVLFGIAHLPKIYLRGAAPPPLVPEAFVLGFVFGIIRDRTGSVYYGMLCHMAYNLIVTVVYAAFL
jgi:membrane protease YdiL (CAAX protease family)